jgi:uncharacterized membrane protein (DUF4010 family)
MAVAFQVVLYVVTWAGDTLGRGGLLATSALSGLTDVDALTFSAGKLAPSIGAPAAARALAVGVLANTVFKLGVVLALGQSTLRARSGVALFAMLLAGVGSLLVAG